MTSTESETGEMLAVAAAIQDATALASKHETQARLVAQWMGLSIALLLFAGWLAYMAGVWAGVLVVSKFDAAADKSRQAIFAADRAASGTPRVGDLQFDLLVRETRDQVNVVAGYAKSTGVQNSLLLAGVGFVALVFALSMSVYRHHLVEVSKLQHTRLAFTRVRVAMHSTSTKISSLIVQQALLDRAFEYRSGKEKQVESPVPGHPVSDASAQITQQLIEALSKRQAPNP